MNDSVGQSQNLAVDLGIDSLPEAEKQEILTRIGNIIFQRVMGQVIESLPEDKRKELSEVFDQSAKDPHVLLSFLQTNVPDFDSLVSNEVAKLRQESITTMGSSN